MAQALQCAHPDWCAGEMLQNSRKTTSPAIAADERVKDAVKEVGTMPPSDAVDLLERVIAEARAVGVRDTSPNLKRALALRGTLATAAGSAAAASGVETTDPQKAAFDALFGGGYSFPDDDLDLD